MKRAISKLSGVFLPASEATATTTASSGRRTLDRVSRTGTDRQRGCIGEVRAGEVVISIEQRTILAMPFRLGTVGHEGLGFDRTTVLDISPNRKHLLHAYFIEPVGISSQLIQAANPLFAHRPNARKELAIRGFDQFEAWRQSLQAAHPRSVAVHYGANCSCRSSAEWLSWSEDP
jgi:hypothetical protein